MHFDAGKLNRRISFMKNGESVNEIGQTVQAKVMHKTVWASVEPLRAYEQTEQQRLIPEVLHRITTRYHNDISYDMTISYNGKEFEITQIVDIEGRGYALEILAVERVIR